MESDGPRTEEVNAESSPRGNVVPFPRDWIAPQEELVPFGSDPTSQTADGDTRALERPAAADDFWSEGTWALQHPLEAPTRDQDAADEDAFDWGAPANSRGGTPRISPRSWFTRAWEWRVASVRTAQLLAIGAIALAVLGVVVAHLGGSPSATRPAAQASSEAIRHGDAVSNGLRRLLTVASTRQHPVASNHGGGRHRAHVHHRSVTGGRQAAAGPSQVSRPTSESSPTPPVVSQAQQAAEFSPPASSGGGQPVGYTATTTSETHSSPPTGPSGRHALLGPGECGGCK